jgi:hypothetical protein
MGEAMVNVWIARCPLGDVCSKKGGILGKKLTEEEAREVIVWHLKASPYHEMGEDEAIAVAHTQELDTWEEKQSVWEQGETDTGEAWYNNRKRKRPDVPAHRGGGCGGGGARGDELGKALSILARAVGTVGGGSDSSSSALAVRSTAGETVAMSKVQLMACPDSLRRAKTAAQSAASLCSRAARAFTEESEVIDGCAGVIESYLT